MKKLLLWLALAASCSASFAAPKTVTLSVPSMNCAACPITVKKALTRVAGVSRAEVSYDKRQAIVTFDDSRTTVEALTKASADAGYPATVKQ